MEHVLVSDFETYWDNLRGACGFWESMVRNGAYESLNGETTCTAKFIKINGARHVTAGWNGKLYKIAKKDNNKIYFQVEITDVIPNEELKAYEGLSIGWSLKEETGKADTFENLYPAFLGELETTTSFRRFEELTEFFLRLMGIHRTYRFPLDDQAGKADGFFKIGNLAILYDCTLQDGWEEFKRQQISNYCTQLLTGVIEFPQVREIISSHQKQVWIITRGQSRVIQINGDRENIVIKEIAIKDLKKLYLNRIKVSLNEFEFEDKLKCIGQN